MKSFLLLLLSTITCQFLIAQNVGINTTTPLGKLHIKGSADTSQLVIDANSTQTNLRPLIRLRKSDGNDLLWIHSDNNSNSFLGLGGGRVNNASGGAIFNTFIGGSAGFSNTLGYGNTAIGTASLYSNSTASENTAVGTRALFSQSFNNSNSSWPSANTAVGFDALYSNQPIFPQNGRWNTAVGHSALYNNTIGIANTGIGKESLYANVSGNYNTASGNGSLYANVSGQNNTASGYRSLYANVSGDDNTAFGYFSLTSNTIGIHNTALGNLALLHNTTASQNTAIGYAALGNQSFSNSIASPNTAWYSGNTAVGFEALTSNNPSDATNGINNTAVGAYALRNNATGYNNTGVGVTALFSNTTGYQNIAIGRQALFYNTTGGLNTAIGYKALRNNNGELNTAYGNFALENNLTGNFNLALGYYSLNNNTVGSNNTAIGTDAQNDGINSSFNTIIGASARIAANVNNSTVIGHGAYTNTPNLALLGSPSTAFTGGYNNWTNFSDGRFKKDVDESVKGLDFILRLRPVTYHMDVRGLYKFWGISPYGKEDSLGSKSSVLMDDAITKKEAIRMTGFVAQEVEKAAMDSHYDFDGVIKPSHDKDHYRIAYGEFVVPLVKAMQEQQVIIEKQNKLIDDLLKRVTALETKQ